MALALDGFVTGTVSTGAGGGSVVLTLPTLTTTGGPGLICVACITNSQIGPITSVTATGLGFTQRTAVNDGSGNNASNWYAPYTSNFSGAIVVNATATAGGRTTATAFGISSAPAVFTGSSFDSNAPTTDNTGAGPLSLTTANANDFVFTNYEIGSTGTVGAGWILLNGSNGNFVEYQILSSVGTVTGTIGGSGFENVGILDAVVAGATPNTPGYTAFIPYVVPEW